MRITDITPVKPKSNKKIRLAAYARVSTKSEEQIHSFLAQIRYYNQFVKEHPVHIAALTVPKDQASRIAGRLAEVGVEAFWNFASTDLKVPSHVVVENVHLAESLMRLSYRLSEKDK